MWTKQWIGLLGLAGLLSVGGFTSSALAQDEAAEHATADEATADEDTTMSRDADAVDAADAGDAAADADKPAEREVDILVISDPSHEKMNEQAPDTFEVLFKTTAGDFTVAVTRDWAPKGADRFYNLVKNGYYDGNRFFRVVPGFVVQWGLHGNAAVNKAWLANRAAGQIKDDPVKESNTKGRVVFASAGPDTRTTQLFINLENNPRLNGMGFAPFGEVKGEGMKVVSKIYDQYEAPGSLQNAIIQRGNEVLDEFFPKMDGIKTATIVEPEDAEPEDAEQGENAEEAESAKAD